MEINGTEMERSFKWALNDTAIITSYESLLVLYFCVNKSNDGSVITKCFIIFI